MSADKRFNELMIIASTSNARSIQTVSARSPAKINLSLELLGRREDGYHDIRSLVLGIDFNDTLRFECAEPGTISLRCDDPTLATDGSNLIVQAARALSASAPSAVGVRIDLSKRIPIGSGLGGGSGNAASTLAALNRLWGLDCSDADLATLGGELGSDVPLFFSLPSALITGRGERVRQTRLHWSGWVLLVFAGCPVSTREVYARWSRDAGAGAVDVVDGLSEVQTADELAHLCVNELESAVFRVAPEVRDLHEAVRACSPRPVRISGAGQTAFIPFDDPEEGEFVRSQLQSKGIGTESRLVRTLTGPLAIE